MNETTFLANTHAVTSRSAGWIVQGPSRVPWLPPFTIYNVNIGPGRRFGSTRSPFKQSHVYVPHLGGRPRLNYCNVTGFPHFHGRESRADRGRALRGVNRRQETAHVRVRGVPISDSSDTKPRVNPEDTALANPARLCNLRPSPRLFHTLSS